MQRDETRTRSLDRTFTFKGKLTPFETVAHTISSRNVIVGLCFRTRQFLSLGTEKHSVVGIGRSPPCFSWCSVTRRRSHHRGSLVHSVRFYPKGQGRFLLNSSSHVAQQVSSGCNDTERQHVRLLFSSS